MPDRVETAERVSVAPARVKQTVAVAHEAAAGRGQAARTEVSAAVVASTSQASVTVPSVPSGSAPVPTPPAPLAAAPSAAGGTNAPHDSNPAAPIQAAPIAEATAPRELPATTAIAQGAVAPQQDLALPVSDSAAAPTLSSPPADAQGVPAVAASAPATAAPATNPTATVTPSQHAAPASQVAPALLTLASSSSGAQHMTLRLQPADLGTVQIRIDRPVEAPVRVEVSASRQETLTLLLRDQNELQRTLDQAGVPQEGRSLTFQLTDQDGGGLPRHPDSFTQPGSDSPSTPTGDTSTDPTESDTPTLAGIPALAGWRRAGLDITA